MQDLEAGPIKSVHFSQVAKARLEGAHTLEDFFSAPDFVIGSRTGSIVAVRSGSFEETSSAEPAHRLLVQVAHVPCPACTAWHCCAWSTDGLLLQCTVPQHGGGAVVVPHRLWFPRGLLSLRTCASLSEQLGS